MSHATRILAVSLLLPVATITMCVVCAFDARTPCTRCGKETTRSWAREYSAHGKPDIVLCPECHYAQAEAYLKFFPIECEGVPVIGH